MNWPLSAASRLEILGTGTGTGTTVTANATGNTKSAAATIGSTTFAWSGFIVQAEPSPGGARRYRFDVVANNGGSDQVIVADYYFEFPNGTGVPQCIAVDFPVAVPSGASLKIKLQSSTGSETAVFTILGYALDTPGPVGASRVVSCTDWTNTQPTNSVTQTNTTFTAWTTIVASTPARVSRLWLNPSNAGDTGRTATDFLVEIAVGAAAAEQRIASFFGKQVATFCQFGGWQFPCDIPAGTRLSFRVQTASGVAADSMGVAAVGLAA